jgi:HEAT repeat protein
MPQPAVTFMPADAAARLADFARACKAAARAVSLYPGAHPAIAASLGKLSETSARLTDDGPLRIQVASDRLTIDGAAAAKPDPAIGELASLLHRHFIGALTLNPGADASSWRALLLLLARPPEEVRADGGIAKLWSTAGGPSLEVSEIDYAEVLREKQGQEAAIDEIIAAALAGPTLRMDDSGMQLLLDIVGDPARLRDLMKKLEAAAAGGEADSQSAAFLSILRGLTDWIGRNHPEKLESVLGHVSQAAGHLNAGAMLHLLRERHRRDGTPGTGNVANAVIERMSDSSVSHFLSQSVIAERGPTERLAQAFQALVPDQERQRKLLALAESEVAASELGGEDTFGDLWQRVESLLTSYSDKSWVSDEYGRELSSARVQAVDVERISDDPPDRIAAWLSTVSDGALRQLDSDLLVDLLVIETDPLRWRDVADTVMRYADDLVRAGRFDQAWFLADVVVRESESDATRREQAMPALERFGRGSMMKHVAAHLRSAEEDAYDRFKKLCHAIGPPVVAPLAEVLSSEQDARSRRRLRDILLAFGAQGRESVQRLMNAPNWEVRRTAALLLREFGGSEGLKELLPLLADNEPLVQREAVQGLLLNGSEDASRILLDAVRTTSGRAHETLISQITAGRDERSMPFFRYLVQHMERRVEPRLYLMAVEALGSAGGPESVAALKFALYLTEWKAPFEARRVRTAAAAALRRMGTPPALDALREATRTGSRSVRSVARAALESS